MIISLKGTGMAFVWTLDTFFRHQGGKGKYSMFFNAFEIAMWSGSQVIPCAHARGAALVPTMQRRLHRFFSENP